MTIKDRLKILLMTTPFDQMESALDEFLKTVPSDLAQAANDIAKLTEANNQLMMRLRKLEEENHQLRIT